MPCVLYPCSAAMTLLVRTPKQGKDGRTVEQSRAIPVYYCHPKNWLFKLWLEKLPAVFKDPQPGAPADQYDADFCARTRLLVEG